MHIHAPLRQFFRREIPSIAPVATLTPATGSMFAERRIAPRLYPQNANVLWRNVPSRSPIAISSSDLSSSIAVALGAHQDVNRVFNVYAMAAEVRNISIRPFSTSGTCSYCHFRS